MKVYVSVDIEGVTGVTGADECRKDGAGYREAARQMTAEAAAACEGALAAGVTDIVVKDAHGDGRNLAPSDLPRPAQLVRSYSGHPFAMVQELDETFDAALFVGWHARAGSGGNPLAHTLSSKKLHEVRLDGTPASEYLLHAAAAASVGVPVVLVTGDRDLCEEVTAHDPTIRTVPVKAGSGATTHNIHPAVAVDAIRAEAEAALRPPLPPVPAPPGPARLEVVYVDQAAAYARSWYPGARLTDPHTVCLEAERYFDVLRALVFLVGL